MSTRLNTRGPRRLLRYPELWGSDLLCTASRASRLLSEANRAAGQDRVGQRQHRLYGCQKAEHWLLYRCSWLFARTVLRDVAPDEVIRVAPGEEAGTYRVVERWRYRREYRNLDELVRLVDRFYGQLLRQRSKAVFSLDPVAPG
jgi:hypothetical protein